MTRYSVLLHREQPEYLAACYAPTGNGIRTTLQAEDACSWVLPETAFSCECPVISDADA